MLPIILQKCLPMAKDVARKSCNRMLWVTSRTINLLSHLTVRLTIVVLTLVKFHLQKCEQCILFLAGWKKNCSPSGFLLFHMHLQISVFHHLKNCSRGVACRRAHSEHSRADWAVAGSSGEDLQQLDDTVTLFYCNAGAHQCRRVSHWCIFNRFRAATESRRTTPSRISLKLVLKWSGWYQSDKTTPDLYF